MKKPFENKRGSDVSSVGVQSPSGKTQQSPSVAVAHKFLKEIETGAHDFHASFITARLQIPWHWFADDYVQAFKSESSDSEYDFDVFRDLEKSGSSLAPKFRLTYPGPPFNPQGYRNVYARKLALILNSAFVGARDVPNRIGWLSETIKGYLAVIETQSHRIS